MERNLALLESPTTIKDRPENPPDNGISRVAVHFRGVAKRYRGGRQDVVGLVGLNLQIYDGETFAFIGPNGSGKSTAVKCLLGLVPADSGETRLWGRRSSDYAARQGVGYVPEQAVCPAHLTGREWLFLNARLLGLGKSGASEAVRQVQNLADLGASLDRRVGGYSKGMRQRLGLARALLGDPRLLVLDEPATGLDPWAEDALRTLLGTLRGAGKTLLVCTHQLDWVARFCDRAALLHRGRLLWCGSPAETDCFQDFCARLMEHDATDLGSETA